MSEQGKGLLEKLPPAPEGRKGWPWDIESAPPVHKDYSDWPVISIVTPSFNQGNFLEETIRSVLLQNYPFLEYIIIDGGSSDSSVEIIKKYQEYLTYWVSEPDKSQSDAINKGFAKCSGQLSNWICSDDMLCRDALNVFAEKFYAGNSHLYIGKCYLADKESRITGSTISTIETLGQLLDIKNRWRKNDSIAQQATLYPLETFRKTGGLKVDNHYAMDYELWGDLLQNGVSIKNIPVEIGIFRCYEGQKTSQATRATNDLVKSALRLIRSSKEMKWLVKQLTRISLINYYTSFKYHQFRSFIGIRRRLIRITGYGKKSL